ncbi:LysR family transcriptional regulator [Anianabacter salinae]|uniref:LysR family transcriptional regulator n=1 Tax=Anianabacter salinae TaxID=2851023 RepID=UPI00225E383D|nr:LysR family transcriptional regulator [Anianabacter salinae]MBV0912111.1 LysR family transcriptional regulator [Anianabacter salinae]
MHKDNWDDLRFLLAVAETGSVSSAARQLGVNHATVLRRISALETRLGSAIFEKTAQGYSVPPDRAAVVEAARAAQAAMLDVGAILRGTRAPISGRVRITSTDSLCQTVLPPMAQRLQSESRDLKVELLSSNTHLNLARLHADITVRPAMKLADDLVGEQVGEMGFGVYAAPGAPEAWLGVSGPLSRSAVAAWIEDAVSRGAVAGVADSFVTLREMAAAGMGRSVLPAIVGEGDARLRRLPGAMPEFRVPLWVASHSDMADAPRLRTIRARLVEAFAEHASALAGPGDA